MRPELVEGRPAPQWCEVDIPLTGPDVANPYTDADAWVIFTHASGRQLRRPVFWDGGTTYRVRFASTQPEDEWQWSVHTARPDHDFQPAHGVVVAGPPIQDHPHRAVARGFATAHPSGRSFCYADGSPAFWVIDTAWAMPFRATVEDVAVYAADRQAKGFNAVLLMTVQPDMNARGPVGRNVDEGFEVGFDDLPEGRLTKISVEYFQYFDKIIEALIDHGMTPILQPVFHGYGWKGLDVAGPVGAACRLRPILPVPGGALWSAAGDLSAVW
jgi:Protein of unknown function (DUF4038)/Domain of unknown function (DUF5060)